MYVLSHGKCFLKCSCRRETIHTPINAIVKKKRICHNTMHGSSMQIYSVFILYKCTIYNEPVYLHWSTCVSTYSCCCSRCFGLGLGPQACRRLLQGVAKVTGGSTEFLSEEERLQPKVRAFTAPSTGTETQPLLSTQFKEALKSFYILNNTIKYYL